MADLEKPLLYPPKIVFHYALDMSTFQHMITHKHTRGMQRHWHQSQDDWSESWPGPQWAHVAPGQNIPLTMSSMRINIRYTEYFLAYNTTLNPLKVYFCLCFFFIFKNSSHEKWIFSHLTVLLIIRNKNNDLRQNQFRAMNTFLSLSRLHKKGKRWLKKESNVFIQFQIVWCVPTHCTVASSRRVAIGCICPHEPIRVQLSEVSHSRENLKSQNNEPSADLHYFWETDIT